MGSPRTLKKIVILKQISYIDFISIRGDNESNDNIYQLDSLHFKFRMIGIVLNNTLKYEIYLIAFIYPSISL